MNRLVRDDLCIHVLRLITPGRNSDPEIPDSPCTWEPLPMKISARTGHISGGLALKLQILDVLSTPPQYFRFRFAVNQKKFQKPASSPGKNQFFFLVWNTCGKTPDEIHGKDWFPIRVFREQFPRNTAKPGKEFRPNLQMRN